MVIFFSCHIFSEYLAYCRIQNDCITFGDNCCENTSHIPLLTVDRIAKVQRNVADEGIGKRSWWHIFFSCHFSGDEITNYTRKHISVSVMCNGTCNWLIFIICIKLIVSGSSPYASMYKPEHKDSTESTCRELRRFPYHFLTEYAWTLS